MKRDLANITRDLENTKNNDIIRKKAIVQKIFEEDPDLWELLGTKSGLCVQYNKKSIFSFL